MHDAGCCTRVVYIYSYYGPSGPPPPLQQGARCLLAPPKHVRADARSARCRARGEWLVFPKQSFQRGKIHKERQLDCTVVDRLYRWYHLASESRNGVLSQKGVLSQHRDFTPQTLAIALCINMGFLNADKFDLLMFSSNSSSKSNLQRRSVVA